MYFKQIYDMEKEKQYIGPYKVVKVFRGSSRKEVLCRNLSREQAIQMTESFPSNSKTMVVFYKQYSADKYFV